MISFNSNYYCYYIVTLVLSTPSFENWVGRGVLDFSRMLLAGIQGNFGLDPRLKRSLGDELVWRGIEGGIYIGGRPRV